MCIMYACVWMCVYNVCMDVYNVWMCMCIMYVCMYVSVCDRSRINHLGVWL